MKSNSAHLFALYCEPLTSLLGTKKEGHTIVIDDPDIIHRIIHVIRLHQGDMLILFNRHTYILGALEALQGKKVLPIMVRELHTIMPFTPSITLMLPLLKKEALEIALYNAVELGASEIILVTTEKSRTQFQGNHELERYTKIMIAAAEQSKNFAFAPLQAPIAFEHALNKLATGSTGIFCTPEGTSMRVVFERIAQTSTPLVLAVGPEGDFTPAEYTLLIQHNFIPCALTQTILRSPQAVAVALGSLRSYLRVA